MEPKIVHWPDGNFNQEIIPESYKHITGVYYRSIVVNKWVDGENLGHEVY